MTDSARKYGRGLFLAAVVFTAFNLRAPITGVGSLLDAIREDLALSGSLAGSLTTFPLLTFAALSLVAPRFAERVGIGRMMLGAMAAIAAGTVLRSLGGTAGLILGTVLIGAGIGCGNVLLPVVVKARWPDRIGAMTGIYTTAQSLLAGLSSALCVPLSRLAGFGWRGALAVWALPAVAAAVLWIPLASFRAERPAGNGGTGSGAAVWRSRVAWFCTLYMGSQAILYYSFSAWLPAILAARGVDGATAGFMASVYQLIGIVSNFVAPLTAGKLRDQRPLTGAVGVLYLAGALLMLFGRSAAALWPAVLLCGFSTGCCFSLCMALIGMRTRNAQDAARLSGMLQTVGYIIAAFGPVLVGSLLDLSGGWTLPLTAMLAGVAFCGVMGQLAGRPGVVE